MITIKMQANSTVVYSLTKFNTDDCLLVDNYQVDNEIWHLPIEYKRLKDFKSIRSVGIWRIKKQNLKQSKN